MQPDYTGAAIIGNKKYQLAGWINKSRSGSMYMRLIFDEVNLLGSDIENATQSKMPVVQTGIKNEDLADDLPF